MTLRSILVPVRGDGKGEGVLDHALSLAKRHNAHLEVLHCRPKPEDMIPYGVPLPSSLRKSIVGSASSLADEEEGKVRKLFDDYCASHGVPEVDNFPWPQDAVSATWREATGKQANVIGLRGRLVDLIAVPQPDYEQNLGLNTLQAALLESGKLVLMCPAKPVSEVGAKVAIAWNGSGEASRALTAGLPILKEADAVVLLASSEKAQPISAEEAKIYLESHGVSCSVQDFKRGSSSVGEVLLAGAKKAGADCLLMGAYGQSRQRELILGGVTQYVVDHADLPILLMH
ncbi:universal stress protein [Pelagibius marinus]|uniref:universal stress protein n=1 Tax=Pelagibius marinus TaxID=2762760 RepID=UPI0018729FB6|nr:universal stress protein [Pelagibius marinus]